MSGLVERLAKKRDATVLWTAYDSREEKCRKDAEFFLNAIAEEIEVADGSTNATMIAQRNIARWLRSQAGANQGSEGEIP